MPKLPPLCVALSLIACLGCQSSRPDGDPALLLPPLEAPGPWQEDLLAAARSYRGWTRVSDANWAPWLCIAPPPSGALLSESSDRRTHGRKLYYLYTEDSQFYSWVLPRGSQPAIGENPTESAPVGFTIVKEAWSPLEVELADVPRLDSSTHGRRTYPPEYLVDGEKAYRIGEPRGLFVMLKKDPATPDTDEGWVYGTVSADGKTVTSSGRVESCMGCHREASRDRLFGMHVNKSL